MNPIKVAIADDHDLIRQGIRKLIEDDGCIVVIEASNGQDLLQQLSTNTVDVVLMDINMPVCDGISATATLATEQPHVRVIALTALEDELNTIRMLRAGARAYLLKSSRANELRDAITQVHTRGYHFSDLISGRLLHNLNGNFENEDTASLLELNERELEFITHLCTELTNKEIADRMCVSPRTTEGWSKTLCARLGVKSRVGLVLYAFRNQIVH
jgi:DNA-binding NarL/FixJ family response regulator